MFLITNKDNSTFGGFSWAPNSENETDNPNFYFRLYESLESALYLSSFFGHEDFNVWRAEGSGQCSDERVCKRFSKVKVYSLEDFSLPTNDKRIVAAILCSMNLVKNEEFLKWCSLCLKEKNSDTTKSWAAGLSYAVADTDDESELFSCAVPLLSCFTREQDVIKLSGASIFRSVSDSFDVNNPIDLNKILKIVTLVPENEIASMMSFEV